jgi:hypothetical protein
MSRDQKRTALRVASIPEEEFELTVESAAPTVTEMAERDTRKTIVVDLLEGRDPEDRSRYPDGVRSLTACVYFTDGIGKQYGHVTAGSSVYEAAADALDWFRNPYWHRPRPTPVNHPRSFARENGRSAPYG